MIGCAHTSMNLQYQGPKPLPADIAKEFEYTKFQGAFSSKVIKSHNNYLLKQIRFTPSTNIIDLEHDIILDYYEIKRDVKTPTILVLPILGGSNYFSTIFAKYFADNGYSAIIVHRQKRYRSIANLDQIDNILRQIVFNHMQVIDWIEMQENLDSNRIGVLGISMGSIKATLVSALDRRVKASVICLTGGNLAEIVATSNEKEIVRRRNEYLNVNNISIDEFQNLLQKKITCDPINYAEYLDAESVLMVLGRFDSTIPYKNGRQLWLKMGKPEIITMLSGHYTAALGLQYVKMKSLDFFNRKLM